MDAMRAMPRMEPSAMPILAAVGMPGLLGGGDTSVLVGVGVLGVAVEPVAAVGVMDDGNVAVAVAVAEEEEEVMICERVLVGRSAWSTSMRLTRSAERNRSCTLYAFTPPPGKQESS
jgi:hypothetical protein